MAIGFMVNLPLSGGQYSTCVRVLAMENCHTAAHTSGLIAACTHSPYHARVQAIREASTFDALAGRTVLLDCRWLGTGGAGRVTELLLRGLRQVRPPGQWILWGPEVTQTFLWDGSSFYHGRHAPMAFMGQRDFLRVPSHDVGLYMHQMRPLRPGKSATIIHDTIPLRYGGSLFERNLKRQFLRCVDRLSSAIITPSEYSKVCVQRDLGTPPAKVNVIRWPIDQEFVKRVKRERNESMPQDVAVYVGRFAEHKNLRRMMLAFERTRFRRRGGVLLLVGGTATEVNELREFARRRSLGQVSIEGKCSQSRLENLYATARVLVMPSLEEGFGLPAWEAMACGLPVCVSDGGSLPELTVGLARPFPAKSISRMAEAMDDSIEGEVTSAHPPSPAIAIPDCRDFADAIVATLASTLRDPSARRATRAGSGAQRPCAVTTPPPARHYIDGASRLPPSLDEVI